MVLRLLSFASPVRRWSGATCVRCSTQWYACCAGMPGQEQPATLSPLLWRPHAKRNSAFVPLPNAPFLGALGWSSVPFKGRKTFWTSPIMDVGRSPRRPLWATTSSKNSDSPKSGMLAKIRGDAPAEAKISLWSRRFMSMPNFFPTYIRRS